MSAAVDLDAVKAELAAALHQKACIEARDNFYIFVKMLANLMLDGNSYKDGSHIQAIAATLEDVESGEIDRLMLALPPGSMKSVLLMLFCAWSLGRNPAWRIIWISHTADKAQDCSRRVRDLIELPEFREIFPNLLLREDVRGVTEWKVKQGGSFLPKGAGQSIAGYRFNLGILDDPLSEQTARSDVDREKVLNWFYPGFRSRKLPHSRIILVNTRWHVRDLTGYLLDKAARNKYVDQWHNIEIPAILDKKSAEYLMLPEGGSYWPEFMTMQDLIQTREGSTRADWASLYLQSPVADGGNIFTKDDFQDWDEEDPPECVEIIQTLDTAFSEKKSADFSVIQTWGIFYIKLVDEKGRDYQEPNAILLNREAGQWSYPTLRTKAKEQYLKYRPDKIIVETKASGQSLIQDMRLNKLPVQGFQPERDKVSRAHLVTSIIEHGRVWLPMKKKFASEVLNSLLEFPKGAHDDDVDAFVMALLYFKKRYELSQEYSEPENDNEYRASKRSYWKAATSYARRSR